MPAPALPKNPSILDLRELIVDVHASLELDPRTKDLAAPYATFLDQWNGAFSTWLALIDGVTRAKRRIVQIDDTMDQHVDALVEILKARHAELYVHFFGDKPPSIVKRPVLGPELVTVEGWLHDLEAQKAEEVQAFYAVFAADVKAAHAQVKKLKDAEAKRDTFRDFGPLAELVNAFAQERDRTYATLETRRVEHPEWKVPRTWAANVLAVQSGAPAVSEQERKARAEERDAKRKAKAERSEQERKAREDLKNARTRLKELRKKR